MTEAVDFLALCSTSTTGNPVLEQIRDKGADVILALYRMLKNVLVHSIDNDAVKDSARTAADVLGGFAGEVGAAATLTFVDDSTFVCGQLLRASRSVYESAAEVAALLARANVSECAFESDVSEADLVELGRAFAVALRDPDRRDALVAAKIPHVTLRKVDASVRRQTEADLPIQERIVRLYATAIVVMRGFYEDVARGVTILPHKVKRLAQRLVVLSESGDPAMLGMTAMARAHRDDAGRAVQTALLALAIGREITSERIALSRLVMAALLADVGRARVVGLERRGQLVQLGDREESHVAPATALACLATGGVNPSNASRTVTVVEASWMERRDLLGDLWRGELTPLLGSQILTLVSELLGLVAPRDSRRPLSGVDALEVLATKSKVDRTLQRLLVRAIGLVPTGTVVELDTGEWAVVIGPSRRQAHMPLLRVVTDRSGRALDEPAELDLGEGGKPGRIARVIAPERARFNVTRAFV